MRPLVVAGGIVRNRAWVLPRSLEAISAQFCAANIKTFYLTGDNYDATEEFCRELADEHMVVHTGHPGYERTGFDTRPSYSTRNMAELRNAWADEALRRWPTARYLWVVDSDVIPFSDCLMMLMELAQPVVGAIVPVNETGLCTVIEHLDPGDRFRRSGKEREMRRPFRCASVGACYLIRAELFPKLRWSVVPGMRSEDGGFALCARDLKIDLWAEPLARCRHLMKKEEA